MKETPVDLTATKTIALTMYPALGDGLVFLILAHNLRRNGFKVTAFSNFLTAMREYFPEEDIQPYPEQAVRRNMLSTFDLLIYTHYETIPLELDKNDPRILVLFDYKLFRKPVRPIPMVDIVVSLCKEIFTLANVVRTNGFQPRTDLQFRKHHQRVIIHPSASSIVKEWPPARFIALAHRLKKQNYEPVFVIAAAEKPRFPWIFEQGFTVIANPSIAALPQFVYESGWFIGNDSGIGHLASNLGIPTITLVVRRGKGRRWRPAWAPGEILAPWLPLLRWKWKERYWKYFISASRVTRVFNKLAAATCPEVL